MRVLSDEWVDAVIAAIRNDPEWKEKAEGFNATIQFAITDIPGHGGELVFGGKAPDMSEIWKGERRPGCDYTITATYPLFKDLMEGRLSPTMAFMQKKVGLEGNMGTMLKYIGATTRLIAVIKTVPTEWV
jgi:putative sterol carrier protein